jgi:hypothetical protein
MRAFSRRIRTPELLELVERSARQRVVRVQTLEENYALGFAMGSRHPHPNHHSSVVLDRARLRRAGKTADYFNASFFSTGNSGFSDLA